MLERTSRDASLVPAMAPARGRVQGWFTLAGETLLRGRPERGARRRRVAAAVGHALSFATWRSLTREQGLSDAEAEGLMAALVRAGGEDLST
jgi:hypothetical protein